MRYYGTLLSCHSGRCCANQTDSDKEMGHVVRRQDVQFHPWGIMLQVRSTKTLQCQEYVLEMPLYFVPDRVFCVASAIRDHMVKTAGLPSDPIFLKCVQGCRRPILYKEVLCFLKHAVQSIGLPPHEYGVHSMRRSGAAFLHGLGVPLQDLMAMCDWHSLAVLDYLITPTSRKIEIQDKVVRALGTV